MSSSSSSLSFPPPFSSSSSSSPYLRLRSKTRRSQLLDTLALQLGILSVRAGDVYVDDNDSAVSYSPSDLWAQGNGCGSCALSPASGSAYGGTWHDTTFYPDGAARTITLRFTGTGISAYFIIPDRQQGTASVDTSLTFTLDGSSAGSYSHTQSGSADFLYNRRAFSTSGLSNSEHTLVVSAGASSDGGSTAVLFDFFVYTAPDEASTTMVVVTSSSSENSEPRSSGSSGSNDESLRTETAEGGPTSAQVISTVQISGTPVVISGSTVIRTLTGSYPLETGGNGITSSSNSSSDSSSNNIGAIVGGVVGGVLGALLLLLLFFCCRKRVRAEPNLVHADEAPSSPETAGTQESSGWMRHLLCVNDSSSMLMSHPVIFSDNTVDIRRDSHVQPIEKRRFMKELPMRG